VRRTATPTDTSLAAARGCRRGCQTPERRRLGVSAPGSAFERAVEGGWMPGLARGGFLGGPQR